MIDFLRYRVPTLLFSLVIIVSFVGVGLYRYQERGSVFTLSVDFTGGTQVLLNFDQATGSAQVRDIVDSAGWRGATTRNFSDRDVAVRVADFSSDAKGVAQRILTAVREALPERQVEIRQTEHVGEGVGKDLWWRSLLAIMIALAAMLAYMAMRFMSASYAVGAVVALFHDALVMLAVFLFFDREISVNVIGAILTVMGYSINDTIVIFSKIRDARVRNASAPLKQLVNESINHTLKRTILTSVSTGLPVLAMLVLGGEALRDFSIALLVGVVFGTYSSVYIASPVMMLFYPKES